MSDLISRLEFEPFADKSNSLRESAGAKPKGTLDDARLAADVARKVEHAGLAFAQRAHQFETLDRRVGRLQRLEAADGADQLLQLAMVGLDDVVQVLGLSMDGVPRDIYPPSSTRQAPRRRSAPCPC